ncbi:hypothetical protein FQN54_001955 [Arachnomyces sp. PD_36]|nr:hypothetical protein FQN54_001955 [Arachnomyces sp. PD_36]
MPTPSANTPLLPTHAVDDVSAYHPSCPPETDRIPTWRESSEVSIVNNADDGAGSPAQTTLPRQISNSVMRGSDTRSQSSLEIETSPQPSGGKLAQQDDDVVMSSSSSSSSPVNVSTESKEGRASPTMQPPPVSTTPSTPSSLNYQFSNVRLLPNHTSSFLRAGNKFVGTQQSDSQVYNVDVEIKHVDIAESYLCGYLRIQGLADDHPTLTTFFEGELIGTKHTFRTRHPSWGANDRTDFHHWSRFPAWRPLSKAAREQPDFTFRDFAQRDNVFMRWKEYFLVPDHRVRTITGASFEGFYYICFNQVEGTVSGIYYHAKSEKYQQLELKHVENYGCFGAMEFR